VVLPLPSCGSAERAPPDGGVPCAAHPGGAAHNARLRRADARWSARTG